MGLPRAEDSPGGPCGSGPSARILVRIVHKPFLTPPMIHDDIRTLLEAPPSGEDAPSLDYIEHTLTAGYARALALEAERWRLERKIADVAARLGDEVTDEDTSELAQLGQRLSSADDDLSDLRALLASLRSRADEARSPAA
jgi:hypothetical protein